MHKPRMVTITEYGCVGTQDSAYDFGSAKIEKRDFDELKQLVLTEGTDASHIFTLKNKKGYGEVCQTKSYVGVVQLHTGLIIEILPKIAGVGNPDGSRKIFLKMLRTLQSTRFKHLNESSLQTMKFPILEVFITLFLKELETLVKKGIKKNYVTREENLSLVRGKILVKQNMQINLMHPERFFCSYDEFIEDIPENRLIKSCLHLLSTKTNQPRSKQQIKEFLHMFDMVSPSNAIAKDMQSVQNLGRLHTYYEPVLERVQIFLLGKSIVNFAGQTFTLAILFPMEKLFESYVATKLKKEYPSRHIRTQERRHYLVEKHGTGRKFLLKPDIVIDDHIVADTKWKVIDENKPKENYAIGQGDMYQLFAYAKKYTSTQVYLIYPKSETFTQPLEPFVYDTAPGTEITLRVVPYDLQTDECMLQLGFL